MPNNVGAVKALCTVLVQKVKQLVLVCLFELEKYLMSHVFIPE